MEPDWVQHAIWWHLHPLSFVGAESDSAGVEPAHRLGRIVDWFDYAVELGVSGIALGPVFASRTHGYDTTDHFRIDPRLGDDTDFRVLLAAALDRGLRVLLDGVFNHVGREFPAFVAAEAGGPEAAWFRRGQDGGWASFEGHEMLVDQRSPLFSDPGLDFCTPQVRPVIVEMPGLVVEDCRSVPFVVDEESVRALGPDAADEPFGVVVGSWCPRWDPRRFDALACGTGFQGRVMSPVWSTGAQSAVPGLGEGRRALARSGTGTRLVPCRRGRSMVRRSGWLCWSVMPSWRSSPR